MLPFTCFSFEFLSKSEPKFTNITKSRLFSREWIRQDNWQENRKFSLKYCRMSIILIDDNSNYSYMSGILFLYHCFCFVLLLQWAGQFNIGSCNFAVETVGWARTHYHLFDSSTFIADIQFIRSFVCDSRWTVYIFWFNWNAYSIFKRFGINLPENIRSVWFL